MAKINKIIHIEKVTLDDVPITELLGPKAQTQAHSGGTVKFASAHWESP